MKIINDPFRMLLEVMEENYPDAKCDIHFGDILTDGVETFGCTVFPEEKGEEPIIVEVHPSLSLQDATEILAHELAHVVAGEEADHGKEWKEVFDNIHKKFQEKAKGLM